MQTQKLQKFFSECGVMSRRAAEKEILAGRVKVNGVVAEIGRVIDPENDIVEYQGKLLKLPASESKVYILLNKPTGFVTTLSDEKGRRCVSQLVSSIPCRLYPIGRLDMNSQGVLLMTNDGELTNRLTHPKHHVPKVYHVSVNGAVSPEVLSALGSSMVIDGYRIQPVKIEVLSFNGGVTLLSMTLFEGRNRQIRKMCEQVGLKIRKLERVSIGKISADGLAPGKWRHLTSDEVEYLKNYSEDNSNLE